MTRKHFAVKTRWLAPLLALVVAAFTVGAGEARAGSAPFQPDLVEALGRLKRARGPETYAALRAIWETWDRADPASVEEALRAAEGDARLDAGARAYAGLLVAYGRLRRGDVTSAATRIAALGFVSHWLVVGPFDDDGKVGLETAYGPEADFAQAIVPGRAYTGKERPVRFRQVPDAFPFGYLDAGSLVRPEHKVCVYATSFVSAAKGPPRDVSLWVGVGGSFKLFWNGTAVLTDGATRRYDADRFAVTVRLERGMNNLTVKACNEDAAPLLSVRLADASGKPDPDLASTNTLVASVSSAETVRGMKAGGRVPRGRAEGPLQAFERLTRHGRPRPEDLESHARYLVSTGGDDPAAHRARDLGQRAAEAAPTVDRLLFAAALAEDGNQRERWIERAEQLARLPDRRTLLARAALARERKDVRRAFPLYARVLAQDPDDVTALRGEVELYNQVGLKRSALDVLQRATERNPSSVLVLNMLASQLRALGRATEASEVESRYGALRFDDRALIGRMVDLGVARRSREATLRWLDRLLSIEPDGQWARGAAARAYRALGHGERAVATLRGALDLAPEDTGTRRQLADLVGELGDRNEQLALLGRILTVSPQDKEVRQYVEHLEPRGSRLDEAFAWEADRFLKGRTAAAGGQNRRTLLDLTVTRVFENGLSSKFRQIVFQPLSDSSAAMARQYAFQYQADSERVQLRGARVFRSDGTVDEAVESGEGAADDPSIAMYTSARTFYVQFPRLEPGDVVELRYRTDTMSSQNQFADYFGETTYLQSSDPTGHAEYVLVSPKSRTLHFDVRGMPGLHEETRDSGELRIHRFFADDVPAITAEPAMPPWPSVLGFVHVSTARGWKELGSWYWGLIKEQFDLDDETRKLARQITLGKETPLDKVRAVYNWVVSSTRYVALEFGIYGYKPHRCVQTVSRGWGDCKDKATVIVTLLKELGIDATIVIVRSGLRGDFASKVASLAPFDHAIAYVPSLDLYLDGTAEFTGSSELPAMDIGAVALRVNQGNAELVRLPVPDPERNLRRREIVATLRRDGSAQLDLGLETAGTAAASWRRRFHAEGTRRARITEEFGGEFAGFELMPGPPAIQVENVDDLERPVALRVHGSAARFGRQEGGNLSLPVTPAVRLTPTYATLSTRRLPLHLPPIGTLDDTVVVKLPPGFRVVTAPAGARGETPFGTYSVVTEETPGKVSVHTRLTIRVLRISPDQYADWKRFCASVDAALTPRLVVGPP